MSTQSQIENQLNDLIAISRDGCEFYEEAARNVDDSDLSGLFRRIAGVKAEIVAQLSTAVTAVGGKPEQKGTLAGNMQQMYARLRSSLGDRDYGYVAELEESEDRLMDAFDDVIQDDRTPSLARDAALRLLPGVRACHEVMRNRKQMMKRAA